MEISEIYVKYNIMPMLQLHQLRVAAVASVICDNLDKRVNKYLIVSACLLHDMGNIIKSDIKYFAQNKEPSKIEYWENVKKSFIKKYGSDEKIATLRIAEEIGVNKQIYKMISSFGFSKAKKIYEGKNIETKINIYSDMRASPHGITSLQHRLNDLKYRYVEVQKKYDREGHDFLASFIFKIEEQIFANCRIIPDEITEEKILPVAEKLRSFEINTG